MSTAVVVDDTDSGIQYIGPWFADSSGSQDKAGNFGPAFRSTLHGTTLNASLAYSFNGTQVTVFGSNNLRNDSGVLDPTWECFVDHISIGATTPFQFAENNWVFCQQDTLVDGPHVLTVNATVLKSQTFWFDQIQYVPSATVPLDNKTIFIDNLDPQLQSAYGKGWQALGGTANMTGQTNSAFTFNFTGISLSWYGFVPTELPHAATTATYSVDGNTPVNFLLQGLPASSATIYNQKFFETEQFAQGNHQIIVLFEGNGQTTPLTLDYLVIQNGTTPQNTTTPTSSPPSSSLNQNKSKSNIGAIVGGVVGAVVFIILVILGYLYIRRRGKRISLNEKGNSPFDLDPQPFIYSPVPLETSVLDGYPKPGERGLASTANNERGHNQMPSVSTTNFTHSVDPPSTAAGSTFPSTVASAGHQPMSSISTRREPPNASMYASASSTNLSSSRSEKEQLEAAATAAALRPQRRNNGGLPSPPISDASSRLVMHQDSGIRLPTNLGADTVEEIPPEYTAG